MRFLGRERELSIIDNALTKAGDGNAVTVLIAGRAGVGKSSLVRCLTEKTPVSIYTGICREGTTPSYGPLIDVMRQVLELEPDILKRCASCRKELAIFFPELGDKPEYIDRNVIVRTLKTFFSAVSENEPAVIFLDDLQWSDNGTVEILPDLIVELKSHPLLFLITYRDDEIGRAHPIRKFRSDLRRLSTTHEIQLGSLSESEMTVLITSELGGEVHPNLSKLIFQKSHGLPFYIEELCKTMQTGNYLVETSHGIDMAEDCSLPVPESIRDIVLPRLDSLSETARNHLEAAALIGKEFSLDLLLELSGTDRGVDELITTGLLYESSPGIGGFSHDLIRDAIRTDIPWTRRRKLHQSIGTLLEQKKAPTKQVAEHWLATNEHKKARACLIESARQSCRLYAYRDAALSVSKALEIWPEEEQKEKRLAAVEQLANCAQIGGLLTEAIKAWREIIDSELVQKDFLRTAEAWRALATLYGLQGNWEQSITARKKAAERLLLADAGDEAANELLAAASRLIGTLQLTDALQTTREASKLATEAKRDDLKAKAMGLEGNILSMMGNYTEGRKIARDGLSLALQNNYTEAASEIYRRLANTLEYASDFSAAKETYTTALQFCRKSGEEVYAQVCLSCMSALLFITGDWKQSLEVCKEVIHQELAPPGSKATAYLTTGLIHLFRGETKSAAQQIQAGYRLIREMNLGILELYYIWSKALSYDFAGENNKASSEYKRMMEVADKTGSKQELAPGYFFATAFFAQQRDVANVGQCAKSFAEMASTGNPEALGGLAFALAETATLENNYESATEQFKRAHQQMSQLEIPLSLILIKFRFGQMLISAGKKSEGMVHLNNAYRMIKNLGARPFAAKIAEQMEAIGEQADDEKEQDLPKSSYGGLTRRQRDVARELAAGLSNKEIAEKLYVSPRTVEMHVSNIFDRLDCRSRTEAVKKINSLGISNNPE